MAARILIVEDNALNMKLVSDLLSIHGYEVIQAKAGEQALDLATTLNPDLILMDIALKGMTGLEITQRLKEDPRTAAIPVVALTAYAGEEDRRRALLAGCDGFIAKPINTRALPCLIAEYLKGGSARGIASERTDPHR